jgi:hypothetical protein
MSGFDAAQTVIAVLTAVEGSTSDGFDWSSDSVSFTQPDGLVEGETREETAAYFLVHLLEDSYAYATFSMVGTYALGDRPPEMGNCRVVCREKDGWQSWVSLKVNFNGMPSAVGTAEDPKVQFQCRAEISINLGAIDPVDSHVDFVLDVDSQGRVACTRHHFEHGTGTVEYSPYFNYRYSIQDHGGL